MTRRNISLLAIVFSLSAASTLFYVISTSNLKTTFSTESEHLAKRDLLVRIVEEYETQINNSRAAKVGLVEEILMCLTDSVSQNKTKSEQGLVVEFIKRSENAKDELTKLDYAYKGLLQESQTKEVIIEFLSQPVINFHDFEYLHNPRNICSQGGSVRFLFVVPSAPGNFDRRSKFRKGSLYQYVSDSSHEMKLLFFLGKPPKEENDTQKRISEELIRFEDIVQEDFEDTYSNIRLKAVAMLRWAHTFCRNAKFVIRTDDDVTMSYHKLFPVVEKKSQLYKNFILGDRKEGWEPHRNNVSKYFLSEEEFPSDKLPPFAVGGLLAYPLSTVSLLYQAALRIKPIWLDDIFITGICAPKVGVPLLSDPVLAFEHKATQV